MLCEWLGYIFCDGKYESTKCSTTTAATNLMILIRLVAFLEIVRLRGQIKYLNSQISSKGAFAPMNREPVVDEFDKERQRCSTKVRK
jgi:hypothetical protein